MELAFGGWSGIVVLVAYGAMMLGVGLVTYLRNRNMRESLDEYYLGGRGLGVMVLFFTFFATQYSGNTVVGYPPAAYRTGYQYLVSVPFFIMFIATYLLFAPRLYALGRRFSLLTPLGVFSGLWGLLLNLFVCVIGSLSSAPIRWNAPTRSK